MVFNGGDGSFGNPIDLVGSDGVFGFGGYGGDVVSGDFGEGGVFVLLKGQVSEFGHFKGESVVFGVVGFGEDEVFGEYGESVGVFGSVVVFEVFGFPLGVGFEDFGAVFGLSLESEEDSG